jgi:hypothetical protein
MAVSQNFTAVYKTDDLLARIARPDTFFVVNFWATWCKPCVEELPAFDSLQAMPHQPPVKVLLVCLDFKEELEKKVKPFLERHRLQAECVLLDEVNGNDFIDRISESWQGSIPATLFAAGKQRVLLEKKMRLSELEEQIGRLSE